MTSITDLVLHPPFRALAGDEGLRFDLSEPWYRSLPVSCIGGLEVQLDGVPVEPERIALRIDGVTRSIAECADAWQEFWFVQEPAQVTVQGAQVDERVRIGVHLAMRIPYIMVGPETALPHHVVQEETFEVTR